MAAVTANRGRTNQDELFHEVNVQGGRNDLFTKANAETVEKSKTLYDRLSKAAIEAGNELKSAYAEVITDILHHVTTLEGFLPSDTFYSLNGQITFQHNVGDNQLHIAFKPPTKRRPSAFCYVNLTTCNGSHVVQVKDSQIEAQSREIVDANTNQPLKAFVKLNGEKEIEVIDKIYNVLLKMEEI